MWLSILMGIIGIIILFMKRIRITHNLQLTGSTTKALGIYLLIGAMFVNHEYGIYIQIALLLILIIVGIIMVIISSRKNDRNNTPKTFLSSKEITVPKSEGNIVDNLDQFLQDQVKKQGGDLITKISSTGDGKDLSVEGYFETLGIVGNIAEGIKTQLNYKLSGHHLVVKFPFTASVVSIFDILKKKDYAKKVRFGGLPNRDAEWILIMIGDWSLENRFDAAKVMSNFDGYIVVITV
jgi:hypothetical protein